MLLRWPGEARPLDPPLSPRGIGEDSLGGSTRAGSFAGGPLPGCRRDICTGEGRSEDAGASLPRCSTMQHGWMMLRPEAGW